MEKKTIGQFIAALRKANGMTQKELAEKLNVSDKAVSRWERDESAPDLSLIPVIAEIFGVTSDEILRGERAGARETATEASSEKGKKQIANLLAKSRSKFQIYSLASIGVASAGLLLAMIFNFGLLMAHIGFFVACVFFVAAIIMEAVFYISAMSSINTEEIDEDVVASTKGYITKWTADICVFVGAMFAFCLPLILLVSDANWGLDAASWIVMGLVFAGVVGLSGLLVIWILTAKEQNVFASSETEIKRSRLKLRYVKITALVLAITGIAHVGFCSVAVEFNYFAKGTTFDNYKDFVEFMETPVDYEYGDEVGMGDVIIQESQVTFPSEDIDEIETETAQFEGSENVDAFITDKDASLQEENVHKEQLCDKDGNVLCEFEERNQSIYMVKYGKEENGYLPITVYTRTEMSFALHIMNNVVNPICAMVYVIEIVGGFYCYFKKRNK